MPLLVNEYIEGTVATHTYMHPTMAYFSGIAAKVLKCILTFSICMRFYLPYLCLIFQVSRITPRDLEYDRARFIICSHYLPLSVPIFMICSHYLSYIVTILMLL